ncbi:MAG: homoserine dehydrogenase [bacterium]
MKQVNIGILGFGNIGSAVAEVIKKNNKIIAERSGLQLNVKSIFDVRPISSPYHLTPTAYDLINDPEISVVVETIGGVKPAKDLVLSALKVGKHVVTSNKELVALHMEELLKTAKEKGVSLLFEGAVGGGIPILNTIRDQLAANQINEVYGIVNGTTNYILSKMTKEGMEFSEALKRAQEKGFAEADPKADVEGFDASYKAAILASVAFGAKVEWKNVYREGIEKVTAEDINYALDIGYVIKLLAIAKRNGDSLEVRVHPALVANSHPLANVSDNYNAIYVKGEPVGDLMFYGQGAGGAPTASAVIGDIICVSNYKLPTTNYQLNEHKIRKIDEITARYYIRLHTADHPGVLAEISKLFAGKKVSIAAVNQKERVDDTATIVILAHEVTEKNLNAAIAAIKKLPVVRQVGNVIRIL